MTQRWGVVGGGLLGLTLAERLSTAGHSVALFEAAPQIGGLAGAWRIGDVVWDRFYHVTLASDAALLRLLSRLGLADRISWRRPTSRFFIRGRLYRFDSALDFLRFPAVGPVSKARMAATLWRASQIQEARDLDTLTAAEWLKRWSGQRAYERVWEPLLRAKLGEMAEEASASFIWAVARRLYAARRAGLSQERFGLVQGGYATVLERFATLLRRQGVAIHTGCPVHTVERQGSSMRVRTGAGERRFDEVVVTTPSPVTARLCPELTAEERASLVDHPHIGVVCASLLLTRPLSGAYLTYIADRSIPLTAVIEMTALLDRNQTDGAHLVYLPHYAKRGSRWFHAGDAEIQIEMLAGLRKIHPDLRQDEIVAFQIARAPLVLPVPLPGGARAPRPVTTSVPGLAIVNATQIIDGTLNANETIMLAERVSAALLNGSPVQEAAA